MRITISDFPDEGALKEEAWKGLTSHCRASRSDVVALPEMPFCDWKMFMTREVDQQGWAAAVAVHDEMIARMGELSARLVLSSRPMSRNGKRFNQAFYWTPKEGYVGGHCKYYLPDEPDGWEATWFSRGDQDFTPVTAANLKVGFQLCTELLFSDTSRAIGQHGAHLIAAPRATSGHRRWPMAASMAAVMSGCFVASTNRRSHSDGAFAGGSWLISPEGETLAATSDDEPYKTVAVDFADANSAKCTYPRSLYVNG